MTQALHNTPMSADSESSLWMPPRRMRQYHLVKSAGAVLFTGIFAGWLVLQWSNPVMRGFIALLVLVTGWITVSSIVADIRRGRGRQVGVQGRSLQVTGPGLALSLPLTQIATGQWRDEWQDDAGLSLLDAQGRRLVLLDGHYLANQTEARAFLNWLRRQTQVHFPVQWPPTA
jgi:hypothetical protein